MYEADEDEYCTNREIREAFDTLDAEENPLVEENPILGSSTPENILQLKASPSVENKEAPPSSSQKDLPKLKEVMPLVNLPELITDYYPHAKVTLSTNPRCKAVWRGGDGFTVSLLTDNSGRWRFYDHKTGQTGDAYDFLTEIVGKDRKEARREIFRLVGINLPEREENFALEPNIKTKLAESLVEAKVAAEKEARARKENLQKEIAEWHSLSKTGTSNYLQRKGIEAITDVEIRFGKENGINFIALPVRNGNSITSIQKIYDQQIDGTDKKFTWGGTITGNYIIIGNTNINRAIVCEGFATGASIYLALQKQVTVFCALNAYNLEPVVKKLKSIVKKVAADNDQGKETNVGLARARLAALKHNKLLAVPNFEDLSSKPTDFNDLHLLSGLDRVQEIIMQAQKPDPSLAELKASINLSNIQPFQHPFSGEILSLESAKAAVKANLTENSKEAFKILKAAYKAIN